LPPLIVSEKSTGFTLLYAALGAANASWNATIPGQVAAIAGSTPKIAIANAVAVALRTFQFPFLLPRRQALESETFPLTALPR
jgi:hypothetical protein